MKTIYRKSTHIGGCEFAPEELKQVAIALKSIPVLRAALERILKEGCLDPRLLCVLQANQALEVSMKVKVRQDKGLK